MTTNVTQLGSKPETIGDKVARIMASAIPEPDPGGKTRDELRQAIDSLGVCVGLAARLHRDALAAMRRLEKIDPRRRTR